MEDKLLVDPAPDFISALAIALGKQPATIERVTASPRQPHTQQLDGRAQRAPRQIYVFLPKIHDSANRGNVLFPSVKKG